MFSTVIRQQAEAISEQRAAAVSWAEVLTAELINTPGDQPLWPNLVAEINAAERRVDELAEAENHAWDAYNDATEAEHLDYLAEQDDY